MKLRDLEQWLFWRSGLHSAVLLFTTMVKLSDWSKSLPMRYAYKISEILILSKQIKNHIRDTTIRKAAIPGSPNTPTASIGSSTLPVIWHWAYRLTWGTKLLKSISSSFKIQKTISLLKNVIKGLFLDIEYFPQNDWKNFLAWPDMIKGFA